MMIRTALMSVLDLGRVGLLAVALTGAGCAFAQGSAARGVYKLSGDWYADSMEVSYQPYNVTSGHLTIKYTFSDI